MTWRGGGKELLRKPQDSAGLFRALRKRRRWLLVRHSENCPDDGLGLEKMHKNRRFLRLVRKPESLLPFGGVLWSDGLLARRDSYGIPAAAEGVKA